MLKKLLALLQDSAIYGAGNALGKLINFALLPLYTHLLVPTDKGVINRLSIFAAVFFPLANLGMTNAIFRRFNQEKDPARRREVFSTGIVSVIIASSTLMVIVELGARWISPSVVVDPDLTYLLRISVLTSTLSSVATVHLVTLRAAHRVRTIATINVAKVLTQVLLTIWLVLVEHKGVYGVVLASLITEALFLAIQFAVTSNYFSLTVNRETWRYMIGYGLPFVPHQLQAAALQQFGLYMTGRMLNLDQAGIYGTAAQFATPLAFIIGSIQAAWAPYVYQMHAEEKDAARLFRTAATYYFAGICYLWMGAAIWGPDVLILMCAPRYHPAAALVSLTAMIPLVNGFYLMLSTGIELYDNMRIYPVISLLGLVVVVIAACVLIPLVGPAGAAIATVICSLSMAALAYSFAPRRFPIPYDWQSILGFVILAGVGVLASTLTRGMHWPIRLGAYVALSLAYPALAAAVLLRSSTERHRMLILWNKVTSVRKKRGDVATSDGNGQE